MDPSSPCTRLALLSQFDVQVPVSRTFIHIVEPKNHCGRRSKSSPPGSPSSLSTNEGCSTDDDLKGIPTQKSSFDPSGWSELPVLDVKWKQEEANEVMWIMYERDGHRERFILDCKLKLLLGQVEGDHKWRGLHFMVMRNKTFTGVYLDKFKKTKTRDRRHEDQGHEPEWMCFVQKEVQEIIVCVAADESRLRTAEERARDRAEKAVQCHASVQAADSPSRPRTSVLPMNHVTPHYPPVMPPRLLESSF